MIYFMNMMNLLPADQSFGMAASNSSPSVPDPGKVEKCRIWKTDLHMLVALRREHDHLLTKISPHGELIRANVNLFKNKNNEELFWGWRGRVSKNQLILRNGVKTEIQLGCCKWGRG